MYTFVTGGLRSGKSAYAVRRAAELGAPPWLYVAASLDGDADIKEKLAHDRRDQEAIWSIIEAPPQLGGVLEAERLSGFGAVVVDGFTSWLGNRLGAGKVADKDLLAEVETLADKMYRSVVPLVVVTTEVGLGQVPTTAAERRFLDLAGLANQIVAERASSFVLMVSGAPLRVR